MPLRIAFDLDGTIADMHTALRAQAEQLFSEDELAKVLHGPARDAGAPEEDADGKEGIAELHLTGKQQMLLWEKVKTIENFWGGLSEIEPGIVARIAQAATTRRWEVIFLTTRPSVAGETTQIQSQRWLQAHGFPFPSVFVVQRSRGKIADALQLDAVVDDRPENCLDVAVESKARAILIWYGDPRNVPAGAKRLGVRVATTISEALSLLEQLDDAQKESGVVRSIKRLFGKEAPA